MAQIAAQVIPIYTTTKIPLILFFSLHLLFRIRTCRWKKNYDAGSDNLYVGIMDWRDF